MALGMLILIEVQTIEVHRSANNRRNQPVPAGRWVAIKQLSSKLVVSSQHEFERRLLPLASVQHPNLVTSEVPTGWAPKMQLLVFDYVPGATTLRSLRGSLLHDDDDGNHGDHRKMQQQQQQIKIPWLSRLRVALAAASALTYLHRRCRPRLHHGNLKSANILLPGGGAASAEAQLTDSLTAALVASLPARQQLLAKQLGAQGCLPPECCATSFGGASAVAADVYAFGVLLLELVSGRHPVQRSAEDGSQLLLLCEDVRRMLDEGRPFDVAYPAMAADYPTDEVLTVIKLGLLCTSRSPSNRPSMAEVLQILELIKPL